MKIPRPGAEPLLPPGVDDDTDGAESTPGSGSLFQPRGSYGGTSVSKRNEHTDPNKGEGVAIDVGDGQNLVRPQRQQPSKWFGGVRSCFFKVGEVTKTAAFGVATFAASSIAAGATNYANVWQAGKPEELYNGTVLLITNALTCNYTTTAPDGFKVGFTALNMACSSQSSASVAHVDGVKAGRDVGHLDSLVWIPFIAYCGYKLGRYLEVKARNKALVTQLVREARVVQSCGVVVDESVLKKLICAKFDVVEFPDDDKAAWELLSTVQDELRLHYEECDVAMRQNTMLTASLTLFTELLAAAKPDEQDQIFKEYLARHTPDEIMFGIAASYVEVTSEQVNSLIDSTGFAGTSEERTRLYGILWRLFDETEPGAVAATPARRIQVNAEGGSDPFDSPDTRGDASLLGTGERHKHRPTPGEPRKDKSGSKPLPAGVEAVGSDYEDERSKNPARSTTRRREDDDFDDLFAGSGSTESRRRGMGAHPATGKERRERDLAVAAEERRLRDIATTGMHDAGDGTFEFATDGYSGEPSTQPPPPGEGSLGTTSTRVVSPPPLPLQAGGYSPSEAPLEASRDTGVHLPVAKRPEPKASSRVTNPLQSGNPLERLTAAAAAASSPPPLPRQQVDDGNDSGYSTPDDVVAVLAPNPFVVPESDTTEL